jgi:hypothetical protein
MRRQFLVQASQEAAARCDAVDPERDEIIGLTMRSGVAPRTTAYCTGKRNVGA